jgi:homocysteine S-methyltransferase|tara:strand:- start:42144 stop:42575 length:432 start_codon:yes stop_codon:yes gene_type:complete
VIGRKLNKNCLLLDGAMGTELLHRGVNVSLPLWSASAVEEAPEIVEQIHRDYMKAGADIITTNTFRTTTRTFLKIGASPDEARARAKTSTNEAVRLAKKAASGNVMVAGSIAPLEDCYAPELFPGVVTAIKEFEEQGGMASGE